MKKNKPIYYINGNVRFTILIKNNRYHLDFYTPSGERKRQSTKLPVTQENLQLIKKVIIPDILIIMGTEQTQPQEPTEVTLDEYAQNFFKLEKNRIRESSLKKDLKWYNKYIYPNFGKRLLSTIKKQDLEKWQNHLINATNPKTGTKYKRGYIQNLRSLFNKILQQALYDELIEKNHFTNIPTPKNLKNIDEEQIEREIKPFTPAQMRLILSKAKGFLRNFILLMYATGMRPGEIIALEWSDIDWDREVIYITKSRAGGKDSKPKTKNSTREVDIFTNAKNALISQLELTKGKEKIFLNTVKGNPYHSHNHISRLFKELLRELNIEGQYLYNLRHTFASVMISIPYIDMLSISRMMGHKDLSTTLKIYAKFIKQDEDVRMKKKREIDKQIDIL